MSSQLRLAVVFPEMDYDLIAVLVVLAVVLRRQRNLNDQKRKTSEKRQIAYVRNYWVRRVMLGQLAALRNLLNDQVRILDVNPLHDIRDQVRKYRMPDTLIRVLFSVCSVFLYVFDNIDLHIVHSSRPRLLECRYRTVDIR